MKNIIIYSEPLLGNFTIKDLIYYLQDILDNIDNENHPAIKNDIYSKIKFIIDVLNDSL